MIHRFTIPDRLPSLNELIAKDRTNRFLGGKLKKQTTQLCAVYAANAGLRKIRNPVICRISWVERDSRRDLDNVASATKFIWDGLVNAGILENDSRRWIKGLIHTFPDPDKLRPRIEVELEEIPPILS